MRRTPDTIYRHDTLSTHSAIFPISLVFPIFPVVTVFVRKLSNLILYSSLWISLCAAALVVFTYDVTDSGLAPDPLTGFVFCGTLALYAIHRISGIARVKQHENQGRFEVIERYKSHILVYGILGAVGAAIFFFRLSWSSKQWLILPCLVSLLYVVPVGKNKRLRDVHWIKIFLIAAVWAMLTGVIPYIHTGLAAPGAAILLFFERATFVFAITVPFDIRDMEVDAASGVSTLPHALGLKGSKKLALSVLAVSALITFLLIGMDIYFSNLVIPYIISWGCTAVLIWCAEPRLDDHYYSGLLDGTMFLLPFTYWIWGLLSSV